MPTVFVAPDCTDVFASNLTVRINAAGYNLPESIKFLLSKSTSEKVA